mmetsp:Transcript_58481/g.126521  ORF Transcript_58481/g.126521 Transcript_58481/m.126521 type:complete len:575 (+) Transcript_58481:16-1740(+)
MSSGPSSEEVQVPFTMDFESDTTPTINYLQLILRKLDQLDVKIERHSSNFKEDMADHPWRPSDELLDREGKVHVRGSPVNSNSIDSIVAVLSEKPSKQELMASREAVDYATESPSASVPPSRVNRVAPLSGAHLQRGSRQSTRYMTNLIREDVLGSFVSHESSVTGNCLSGGPKAVRRAVRRSLKQDGCLEAFFGMVIIFNTVLIGIETSERVAGNHNHALLLEVLQNVCLAVYLMELLCHFVARGTRVFESGFARFDTFLVGTSIGLNWIYLPLAGLEWKDPPYRLIKVCVLLRVVKLVKVARNFRRRIGFKTMWPIVEGLIKSWGTMIWTSITLFIMIYVFALAALDIITMNTDLQNDPQIREILNTYFPNLPVTMITLTQFISVDSVASIYLPLIRKKWYLGLFFFPLMVIISIALMNLVTAILVEGAMAQSAQDRKDCLREREQMFSDLIPEMRRVFRSMDLSDKGTISKNDISMCAGALPPQITHVLGKSRAAAFFESLDTDDSGDITEVEFVGGIMQSVMSEGSIELQQILSLQHIQLKRFESLKTIPLVLQEMQKKLSTLESAIAGS